MTKQQKKKKKKKTKENKKIEKWNMKKKKRLMITMNRIIQQSLNHNKSNDIDPEEHDSDVKENANNQNQR